MAEVLECRSTFTVEEAHVAEHLAARGVKVLSTPCLILFMEKTARTCLEEVLGEGLTSVGVRVDIRHRRPVPLGAEVEVRAVGVRDGEQSYLFSVKAYYKGELVGEGIHLRRIVGKDFGR